MKPFYLLAVFFLGLFPNKTKAQYDTTNIQRNYETAFNEIKDMLEGRATLDFKRAVFVSENAYDSTLNFQDYTNAIDYLKELCEAIKPTVKLKDYKAKDRDNMLKNAAIYQCLTKFNYGYTDSLYIGFPPFEYDFEDFTGEKDWSKMFVTKLLQTQKGNCHSLPYLYKILAEVTNTKEVWLAVAPNHIYIKNYSYDWRFTWYNTELTSRTFPVDAWIMASGYISLHAIRNGIYMDTLGIKQSVAMCLTDMARGYERKIAADNEAFILKCTNLALQHFPLSINAMLLKAETLKRLYDKRKDQKVFNELEMLCRKMIELGYEEMPKEMYLDWLTSQDKTSMTEKTPFKEANQRDGNPDGGKPILTLSNGRYYEIHQQDSLEKVGAVIFDTYNNRIAKLLEVDTTYEDVKVRPDVASRFLSIDPIAKSYPELTPYQYAENSPIYGIDLDGLELYPASKYWQEISSAARAKGDLKTASKFDQMIQDQQRLGRRYGVPVVGAMYLGFGYGAVQGYLWLNAARLFTITAPATNYVMRNQMLVGDIGAFAMELFNPGPEPIQTPFRGEELASSVKQLGKYVYNGSKYLLRGESRAPSEILQAGGLFSRSGNGANLLKHVESFGSYKSETGFVSTTTGDNLATAIGAAFAATGKEEGLVYKISSNLANSGIGIKVNEFFKGVLNHVSKYAGQSEVAVYGGVGIDDIQGAYFYIMKNKKLHSTFIPKADFGKAEQIIEDFKKGL